MNADDWDTIGLIPALEGTRAFYFYIDQATGAGEVYEKGVVAWLHQQQTTSGGWDEPVITHRVVAGVPDWDGTESSLVPAGYLDERCHGDRPERFLSGLIGVFLPSINVPTEEDFAEMIESQWRWYLDAKAGLRLPPTSTK